MSTERRKKKLRNEKIWICVAVCVVAALLIFAIVKMIAKKKPQNGGDDLSSVSSVSVESGGQSAETSSEISEEGQPSDGESSAAESSEQADSKAPSSSSGGSSAAAGASTAPAASVSAETGDWMLRLASVAHPLPEGFVQPSVTSIDSQGREIDSRIVGAYNSLVNAAKADGINLYPISAFRPHSTQVSLFNARVERARNEGYSDPVAEAARHVAKPGTSEHELGLAVDFNSVDEENFKNTAEAKWLAAHCAEYGFVIRYPEDKESVTGIIYEPWHVRYVGTENAKRMTELNMCLEEYVDYVDYVGSGNS